MILRNPITQVSKEFECENCKASNGWLDKFKSRYNISFKVVCGESKSVDTETVDEWRIKVKQLISSYEPRNIYNADEPGLFYKILPNKTLSFKNEICTSGKKSKERLTVMLCVNLIGEFEKPLIIGKSKKPRCFKNVDIKRLDLHWEANKKAWMTRCIMTEWLMWFDEKMKKQKRKIILFLDNATSHPDLKLQNINLVFLPPNTTSHCQPLDQGIIQNFKVIYRQMILRRILSQIDVVKDADELPKSITVLDALMWIKQSVKKITGSCVTKCFKKSGFILENLPVDLDNTDLENEIIVGEQLVNMLPTHMQGEDFFLVDENLRTEEDSTDIKLFIITDNDEEETHEETEEPEYTVSNYSEVLTQIQQLSAFTLQKGDVDGYDMLKTAEIYFEKKCSNNQMNLKQTNITQFF
ncbi:unnamed protein product [Macrosiphum euphorbiae]|uniref:HTH CENPB-type domain-containing protein n=1 Tax=Macrosiphum euphorbiae TaxID=13131 RepID=A0AAV0W997_9HEMI|nr:unnamed protein product [Macrosiphum euphorbiae]